MRHRMDSDRAAGLGYLAIWNPLVCLLGSWAGARRDDAMDSPLARPTAKRSS